MEGYLQKRFKTGIVKTFKKKWFVLKDAELKSYQTEDAYRQNVEMYQDCLPLYDVQTVRAASENLGVEVVTKHKTFILVASSATDQKQWIQAIYDMKKVHVPRPVSTSEETTGKRRRKRSSTSSGKSWSESRQNSSQFYINLDEDQATCTAEVGVQADIVPTSETAAKADCSRPVGNEPDAAEQLPDEPASTEREINAEKVEEVHHHSTESEEGYGSHSDGEPPGDPHRVASNVNQPEENASDKNDTTARDNQEVNGIQQLQLMLRISTSQVSEEEEEEDEICHEEEEEDVFSDEDWREEEDLDSEGSIDEDDDGEEKENITSAFDMLKELLKT